MSVNMQAEFVNIYIEKLVNEITELTKTKIILQTQIALLERANKDLEEKYTSLQEVKSKKVGTTPKKGDDF